MSLSSSVAGRLCVILLVGAGLTLAACGGSDNGGAGGTGAATAASAPSAAGYGGSPSTAASGSSSAAAGVLKLTAQESSGLSFDHASLSAKAGKVTLTLDNPSGNGSPHAIAIDGVASQGAIAQPGGTSTVTADLKPGTYTFYCPIGNHRAQGMEGTLKVG
jgi:plastocyanin